MKPKTARRWIRRNMWKLIEAQGERRKLNKQLKKCLEALKK